MNRIVLHPVSAGLVGLMILLSAIIALHAYGFQLRISGGPDFYVRFDAMPVLGAMHVLGSGTALLLGGFQFAARIRNRWRAVHRNVGRIYLISVLVGGIGGLAVATTAAGGVVGRCGFGLLALVWLYSAWQAYAAVRRGDIRQHRVWMVRNFALTFAAVTLRLQLGVLTEGLGVPFAGAYPLVAWSSWVPNLIVAEWFIAPRAEPAGPAAGAS